MARRFKLYPLPPFLDGVVSEEQYSKWLYGRTVAHVNRDKKINPAANRTSYCEAIHAAVWESKGLDAYTNEPLDWHLIGTYNNEHSKLHGRAYKARYGLLPSVDHVESRTGPVIFKICGWRTNDAKNDLSVEEFVSLCRRVVACLGDEKTHSIVSSEREIS